jgi:hypothetical protein
MLTKRSTTDDDYDVTIHPIPCAAGARTPQKVFPSFFAEFYHQFHVAYSRLGNENDSDSAPAAVVAQMSIVHAQGSWRSEVSGDRRVWLLVDGQLIKPKPRHQHGKMASSGKAIACRPKGESLQQGEIVPRHGFLPRGGSVPRDGSVPHGTTLPQEGSSSQGKPSVKNKSSKSGPVSTSSPLPKSSDGSKDPKSSRRAR